MPKKHSKYTKEKSNNSMHNFLTEFEKWLHKTQIYDTTISDNLLAYHFFKASKLTQQDEQLVEAINTESNNKIFKRKLTKKILG